MPKMSNCRDCNKEIKAKGQGVQYPLRGTTCQSCFEDVHFKCDGTSQEALAKFDKDNGWLLWVYKCKSCKSLVKNISDFMVDMRTEMESLRTRVHQLESDRDAMSQEIESLKTENKVLKLRLEKTDDRTSIVSGTLYEMDEKTKDNEGRITSFSLKLKKAKVEILRLGKMMIYCKRVEYWLKQD
jgi:chromosome segregation ATPase